MGRLAELLEMGFGVLRRRRPGQPEVLGDLLPGVRVTFQFDTCSSFCPYYPVFRGQSLAVVAASARPEGNPYIYLADDPEETDRGQWFAIPALELLEITDAFEVLARPESPAAAKGEALSPLGLSRLPVE